MITKPTFLRFTGILVVFAIFIQLIIILYNHFSGYLALENLQDFMARWAFGSLLSIIILPFLSRPDLYLVKKLNKSLPWKKQWKMRVLVELAFCIIIAAFASTTITLVSHAISAYEHTLRSVLISNIMIGSVINLIIIIFLEAWNWYWAREQSEAEKHSLESELKLMRFEILKQQINPHFMFNSLNVLSGLVRKDAELAEEFIEAFADVYRYVVETIDKPTVTLQEELEFAKSYFFLQQIRHGQAIDWKINISTSFLPYHLPPLSLQLLIENAIKHNAFSPGQKLIIDISTENEWLCISNNLNKKISTVRSAGTGLNNLEKRFSLLTDLIPKFVMMENDYLAKIPLLKPDE